MTTPTPEGPYRVADAETGSQTYDNVIGPQGVVAVRMKPVDARFLVQMMNHAHRNALPREVLESLRKIANIETRPQDKNTWVGRALIACRDEARKALDKLIGGS